MSGDEMSWDSSYDTELRGCTENSTISEEHKTVHREHYSYGRELLGGEENSTFSEEHVTVLREHIYYHDEMKNVLERCLYKGQTEGQMAASVYFKQNKPSKPKANLGSLFEQTAKDPIKVQKKRTNS